MDADEGTIEHLKRFFPPEAFSRLAAACEDPFEINEKRHAVVMFADISGFTAMSESLGAEEISHLLSHVFTVLGARVAKYRGMIDKFLGDCILCVFGIADASEPERDACLCALEMMEALPGINAWLGGRQGMFVDLTVGIHSGELVMGIIGSADRLEFTVIGDTVNTASRVQHEADPGQILVTEAVRRKVACHFVLSNAGERRLKNKREALQVWRLEGISLNRATDPGKEPMGREGEMELLLSMATGRVGGGGNESVLIHGDPGTGKTLLLNWLCRKAAEEPGMAVMRLQGERFGADLSCHPIRAALVSARGSAFSAGGNRDALRLAFFDLAQDQCTGKKRLLIAVDDTHCLDRDSRGILEGLLRDFTEAPLLLVATQRSAAAPIGALEASLRLEGLDPEAAGALCERSLGGPCSEALRAWAHRSSQGNPQFLIEAVSGLRGGGLIREGPGGWEFAGKEPEGIPSGLAGLILQKVDSLSFPHRRIARYASLCGSGIPLSILSALTGSSEPDLEDFLVRAEELEIARLAKEGGRAILRFLHGTAQEAIAASILTDAAKHMHLEIADALLGSDAPSEPTAETLALSALHLELGGDRKGAVLRFFQAAEAYTSASDFLSARRVLERAMGLAAAFPADERYGRASFSDGDITSAFTGIRIEAELDLSIIRYAHALCFVNLESERTEDLDSAAELRKEPDLASYRIAATRLHDLNYLGRLGIDEFRRRLDEAASRVGGDLVGFLHLADAYFGLLIAYGARGGGEGVWPELEEAGAAFESALSEALRRPEAMDGSWGNLRAISAGLKANRQSLEGRRLDEDRTDAIAALIEEGLSSLDGEADRLSFIQNCYLGLGRNPGLRLRYELQCIDLAESLGNLAVLAQMHNAAGYDRLEMGEAELAVSHFNEAAAISMKAGWRYELSMARYNLSLAHLVRGDWGRALEEARAAAALREDLPNTRTTTDYTSMAFPLVIQAAALFLMGRREEAGRIADDVAAMPAVTAYPERFPLCRFILDAARAWDPSDPAWRARIEAMAAEGTMAERAVARSLEADMEL